MAQKITMQPEGTLSVPDEPIIPYVEGDGTGVDIWPAAQLVMDAAAAKHGKKIAWKEVLAGQKAFDATGSWLPDETVAAFRERRQTRAPGYENILSVTAGSITHRFGDRVVSTRYVCLPDTVDPRPR